MCRIAPELSERLLMADDDWTCPRAVVFDSPGATVPAEIEPLTGGCQSADVSEDGFEKELLNLFRGRLQLADAIHALIAHEHGGLLFDLAGVAFPGAFAPHDLGNLAYVASVYYALGVAQAERWRA